MLPSSFIFHAQVTPSPPRAKSKNNKIKKPVPPAVRHSVGNNVNVPNQSEYDGVGVPWGGVTAASYAGLVFVQSQSFFDRCRMAKAFRDLDFGLHPIDFWVSALPMKQLPLKDLQFVMSDHVWDFICKCWALYRNGETFFFRAATEIHNSLQRQLIKKLHELYFG